jgi:DNA repair photolyase
MASSSQSANTAVHNVADSRAIRAIESELNLRDQRVERLDAWLQRLDPSTYKKRLPWTGSMERAHARYHQYGAELGVAHRAFEDYFNATRKNTLPEQHLERARLAVRWGEKAIQYARSRFSFN